MTVKFGVSFELLMIRGLEKNNEGERLTKQETKMSGEISNAFRIWQREATSEGLVRGYGGRAPSLQRIFRFFTRKTLNLAKFFCRKRTRQCLIF